MTVPELLAEALRRAKAGDPKGAAKTLESAIAQDKRARRTAGNAIGRIARLASDAEALVGQDIFYDCATFGDDGQGPQIERLCQIPHRIADEARKAGKVLGKP